MAVEKNAKIDATALEIPAPFVNKFQILVSGGNVRVAFAEGFTGQPDNYRSAVVMSVSDARELAQAISESLPAPRSTLAGALGLYSGTENPLSLPSAAAQDLLGPPGTKNG